MHVSEWPSHQLTPATRPKEFEILDLLFGIISKVRAEKTKHKKPMNAECILTLDKKEKEKLEELLQDLKDVMNIKEIKTGKFDVEFC